MADMSTPLDWDLSTQAAPLQRSRAPGALPAPSATVARGTTGPGADFADKLSREPFCWPTPPYASYPVATPQTDPLACEIVGLNDKQTSGRLTFFVPEEGVAHVQLPPARTTLPLRFDQFRSLSLVPPLRPTAMSLGDPHAGLLGHRAHSVYQLTLVSGADLTGETIGHVENAFGLFLFPPCHDVDAPDADGSVTRCFVPRAAYLHFEIGSRIGELLVEQRSATPQQIAAAVDAQQQLRGRKLGDVLVTRQVVTPVQLLEAIERQARMPMVRIGEALLSLGMISDQQLQEALTQQRSDRSVPLGELLVRMGVVSREDLQVALARKMGYPAG